MSIQFDQDFFKEFKERLPEASNKKLVSRSHSLASTHNSLSHTFLLSKLTFNLSKGHYFFVYEVLKTKIEKLQIMGIEADPNEQASLSQPWLLAEKDNLSKKFLNGKTCLIICTFIKEFEWSMILAKLLIDRGAILTIRDSTNGCYPIHYACALLKPELIELFIRRSDFDQDMFDHNLNTPLVYFMVSFSLYLNKLWSPITTTYRNSKKAIFRKKILDRRLKGSNENLDEDISSVDVNVNKASEQKENLDEEFEKKILNALKVYLGHLKRFKLKVNTINRFGYSLLDINSYIIASNKNLESHPFFIMLKQAAIAVETEPSLAEESKLNSASSSSVMSEKNLKQVNTFKSSSYKSGSLIDSILNEAPPTTIRIYLELILKKNLLINLNEMQFPRIIAHEKVVDKDLVYLFLEKQINDCRAATITNNFNKEHAAPQIKREKTLKDDWREKLTTCYHYLEIDRSKSLRKGVPKNELNQSTEQNITVMLNSINKKLPHINDKNEHNIQSRMGKSKK